MEQTAGDIISRGRKKPDREPELLAQKNITEIFQPFFSRPQLVQPISISKNILYYSEIVYNGFFLGTSQDVFFAQWTGPYVIIEDKFFGRK